MGRLAVVVLGALLLLLGGGSASRAGCCGPFYKTGPQWFPDGTRVLYTTQHYAATVRDAAGNERTVLQADLASISPDGSMVAGQTTGGIAVAQLPDGTQRVLASTRAQPFWSPDGRTIAYSGSDAVIRLVDVATGATLSLGSGSVAGWAPDGTRLLAAEGKGLSVVDLDGTHRPLVADGSQPAWSPRGGWIAFSRSGDLWLVRPDGTDAHLLRPKTGPAGWSPDGALIAAPLTDRGELYGGPFETYELGELGLVALDGTARGFAVLALADTRPVWSPDGRQIAFEVDFGNGTGIEAIRPDGTGVRGIVFGCLPPNAPPLYGCTYFGGGSVPPASATEPLRLRVNILGLSLTRRSALQLALRDARTYRVRGAQLRISVSPAGAAVVRPADTTTTWDGVARVDLVPRRRLPRSLRLTVRILAPDGRTLATRTLACHELFLHRGC